MNSLINLGEKEIRVKGRIIRIAHMDGEKFKFVEDPESLLAKVRDCGRRIDVFTFMQKAVDQVPKFKYQMEWDNLAVLSIPSYEKWWNETLGFKARNKAKQAEKKGVTIAEVPFDDVLVKGIWEVYNESPVRQGKPFWHYGKDIETVRKMAGTFLESSIFIGAFLGGHMIGFIKLVTDDTRTQAGLMHITSMMSHKDKAPTNALVAAAVRACAERGIPNLVYSNFAYGKKQYDSLSEFKERNGFQKIDLPRYYIPLTARGRLALRMGLHHSLAERMPESIATRLKTLRNRWYNRKLPVPITGVS